MTVPWHGLFVIILCLYRIFIKWPLQCSCSDDALKRITEKDIQVATFIRHDFPLLSLSFHFMVFPFAWNLSNEMMYTEINTYFHTQPMIRLPMYVTVFVVAFAPFFSQRCEILWCRVSRLIAQT